ncbi:MAG: hypothetical protein ACOH2V_01245 [Candidatus Saccharimonadaceae bacterium]
MKPSARNAKVKKPSTAIAKWSDWKLTEGELPQKRQAESLQKAAHAFSPPKEW